MPLTNIEVETLTLHKAACRKYTSDTPDWEQRRYEIARAVLPEFINNADDTAAMMAVYYADALIAELKKPHHD